MTATESLVYRVDLSDVPEALRGAVRFALLTLAAVCAQRGRVSREELHGLAGGGQAPLAARLVAAGVLEERGGAYVLALAPPISKCRPRIADARVRLAR